MHTFTLYPLLHLLKMLIDGGKAVADGKEKENGGNSISNRKRNHFNMKSDNFSILNAKKGVH